MDMSKELDQIASRIRIDPTELSEREKRIISYKKQGLSLREIADKDDIQLSHGYIRQVYMEITKKTITVDRLKGGD
jgi:DNA-binding NarL/FixJ family response regulator